MPGGLALYWLVMTLLTIFQQYFFFRKKKVGGESSPSGEAKSNA
jgi:membrane protein insertase Oxa1/YidC/SpoIIIJ